MGLSESNNGPREIPMQGDIAIIGLACIYPGAPDLPAYWQNIGAKVDATSDPPSDAWDADTFYQAGTTDNDRVYCKRGGFLGPLAQFDPLRHGIMPSAIDGSEPDQWLALEVARAAFADAGYLQDIPERHRTAVILGKGTYLNRGNLTAAQHGQVTDQTIAILRTLHPELDEAELQAIRHELKRNLPPFNADTAPGLIPNVAVGRIANCLDLMGPSYTVDAACASSLIAVDIARRDLLTGRCDLALVGGIHVVTPVPVLMLFCHLGALSRHEQIRPFDEAADGTLLSEGIGMAVLKRREDAERDGNRIYAVIKGVGVASDGRALSVLAPRVEGEELALRRAYEQSDVSPKTVGLIEAHGTATLVGDATEVQALARVIGERETALPTCALGTVKSMIGHTMPAAGMAGLIKAALALYHRTLPPTIHVDRPSPRLELENTPLYINTERRPWIHGASENPRRAGVNAFGFGGINAHVVLEEAQNVDEQSLPSHDLQWETELFILHGATRNELVEAGNHLKQFLAKAGAFSLKDLAFTLNTSSDLRTHTGLRLAIVAATLPDLQEKLDRALDRITDPACHKIKDVKGIYFFDEPLGRSGKLAFLFPGEGAQYVNMLADLCLHFPQVRAHFDAMDRLFVRHERGYLPSDVIFPRPVFSAEEREESAHRMWQMDVAIEALVTANQALNTLLMDLGIRPDVILGHSTGDFSAMRAAGMLDTEHYDQRILDLNERYRSTAEIGGIPAATLLAVGAGREQVNALLVASGGDGFVAMDNCPHQTVVAGTPAVIDRIFEQAQTQGYLCERLAFDRAYHTPLYAPYAEAVRDLMTGWIVAAPLVPVYSCTTTKPYPASLAEAREVAHEHWIQPVEFRRTVETMYEDGVRLFVEVGPRGNLTSFVEDILRGRPYVAVPADAMHRSGVTQLNHLLGLLAAHAVPMQPDLLYARRVPHLLDLAPAADVLAAGKRSSAPLKLATGWPPMVISAEAAREIRSHLEGGSPSAEVAAHENGHVVHEAIVVDRLSPVELAEVSYPPAASNGNNGAHPMPSSHARTSSDVPPTMPLESSQPAAIPVSAGPTVITPTPIAARAVEEVSGRPPEADGVMTAYLRTMEQFLGAQQDIMQSYLQGAAVQTAPAPRPAAQPVSLPPIVSSSPPPAVPTPFPIVAEAPVQTPPVTPAVSMPESHGEQQIDLERLLLDLVSDKTGYPVEMLGLDLDLEAELGIDSIKRVEILGGLQQATGIQLGNRMDILSASKTLRGVLDTLIEPDGEQTGAEEGRELHPFLGQVVEFAEGRKVVVDIEISLDTCPFLRDHALGRHVSHYDEELAGLPVMPLTMSMELMAQGAALLMPNLRLVEMRDIQAHRWIAPDGVAITLRLQADLQAPSQDVHVRISERSSTVVSGTIPQTPIVEGWLSFAATYPPAPLVQSLVLEEERPGKWTGERLYEEAMFHGPAFRGVTAFQRAGLNGAEAQVMTLPTRSLFPDVAEASLLIDPVLLDQPGQVVGFWAAQMLERAYLVFPYHLDSLRFYGPVLPPDTELSCQARIELRGEQLVRSELQVIQGDRVWAQFIGWEDRRFDLPRPFYELLLAPSNAELATPYPALAALLGEDGYAFRLSVESFAGGLLTGYSAIWQRVLARLVLSRYEHSQWTALKMPEGRRLEWLLARVAAKDAVRRFVRERFGLVLNPADVEIHADSNGRPFVAGAWTNEIPDVPLISLAHSTGIAVAIALSSMAAVGIGVDIEPVGRMSDVVEQLAFAPAEQALIAALPHIQGADWSLRLWCAKEAVAKALGSGMTNGPQSLVIVSIDTATETAWLRPSPSPAGPGPSFAEVELPAYTARDGDLIVAASLYRR